MPRYDIYNHVIQFKPNLTNCPEQGWGDIWQSAEVFILITGLVANTALLWLFLKERKSLSASKVLGVNLAVMDLIYLSIMPVSIIYDVTKQVNKNNSDHSATDFQSPNTAHSVQQAREIFSIFNLIGCPLLLTCMCIERYMAVIKPVLYRRMRKWEYRMAVSAVVWVATLFFCLATGLVGSSIDMVLPVSIIISCLFLLMLTCLGGVLWSLLQQSPAHTTFGNQARSESPLKRRAVKNVLFVVVPAVMSYLPVLMMVPLVFYIKYCNVRIDRVLCEIFELSLLFPNLGVFIGPLFYLSKARQMCCLRGTGKTSNA